MEGGEEKNDKQRSKQSKGRKKIELKRLEKKEDRTSTFSKRKFGIHKKAAEISTLCGAEVGFLAVSPSGNPCTYSTSSINDLAERLLLLRRGTDSPPPRPGFLEEECDALQKILSDEHEISSRLENSVAAGEGSNSVWFDVSLEDLSVDQLADMKRLAEQSHRKIADHLIRRDRLRSAASAATSSGFPRR